MTRAPVKASAWCATDVRPIIGEGPFVTVIVPEKYTPVVNRPVVEHLPGVGEDVVVDEVPSFLVDEYPKAIVRQRLEEVPDGEDDGPVVDNRPIVADGPSLYGPVVL